MSAGALQNLLDVVMQCPDLHAHFSVRCTNSTSWSASSGAAHSPTPHLPDSTGQMYPTAYSPARLLHSLVFPLQYSPVEAVQDPEVPQLQLCGLGAVPFWLGHVGNSRQSLVLAVQ